MDADRLFLDTLDDLESRTGQDASEYDLLRAAALLRELLLDESPLVAQVNCPPKLPLRFKLRVKAQDPEHEFEIWLGINPTAAVEVPVREIDLTELLRVPLVFLPHSRVTVRQVITLAANVRGGIHRGKAKDPAHRAFEDFRLKVRHGGMPLELLLVAEIAKVVLVGLEGLRVAVLERKPAPTPRIPEAARVAVEVIP